MVGIKEIANEAGVSKTTVSLVLNGRHKTGMRISSGVVKRVEETADRLGYVRNELVQSFVKGRSHVIAIIAEFSEYMMPLIKGYSDLAGENGYSIRLISVGKDINDALRKAVECRADGIAAFAMDDERKELIHPDFFKYGIPALGLTKNVTATGIFDQTASAELAVEHLVGLGHRRILCIHSGSHIEGRRNNGYLNVMKKYSLEPLSMIAPFEIEAVLAAGPDAVFCADDHLAMQLLQQLYKLRIFVPDAFSVAGFGNISEGRLTSPSLTTIDEPYYETGLITCRRLINKIETGVTMPLSSITGTLIVRDSTAANTKRRHK